jgi:hypothetical protein
VESKSRVVADHDADVTADSADKSVSGESGEPAPAGADADEVDESRTSGPAFDAPARYLPPKSKRDRRRLAHQQQSQRKASKHERGRGYR